MIMGISFTARRFASSAPSIQIFTLNNKDIIRSQLQAEPIFKQGWTEKLILSAENDTLNAPTTLPITMASKKELFDTVAKENPTKASYSLTFKSYFEYGKTFLKFYRTGLMNVYRNKKAVNKLFKEEIMVPEKVDNRGKIRNIRITNFRELTDELVNLIYLLQIQNEKTGKGQVSNAFNITRSQYQLIKRTSKDFIKLPFFAVTFLIFEETTPLLCYIFPEITPSSCVLPAILPRLLSPATKATSALIEYRKSQPDFDSDDFKSVQSIAIKTPCNMPIQEAKLLVKSLHLTSKYIPIGLYPESTIRDRLLNHFNYLLVDNYLILNNGGVWNLSKEELIWACFERKLVKIDSSKTEYNLDELRLNLLIFITNLEKFNVGYLGVNNLTQLLDISEIDGMLKIRQSMDRKINKA